MSVLTGITRGKIQKPHLVLVYAVDGWGKSTMASEAPTPLFLGAEEGTNSLDVARLPALGTLAQVRAGLADLATDPHDFKTLVVDTLDWLSGVIEASIIEAAHDSKITSIEDFGYGKGRVRVFEAWRELLPLFTALRDKRGMNVILLAHAMVKKFEDPTLPQGYDRYSLKLQDGAKTDVAGLVREYVDAVLFGNYETFVTKDDTRRAIGGGERILYTERRPGYEAKNRFSLPATLPMVKGKMWAEYAKYVEVAPARAEDAAVLSEQIEALVRRVKQAELVPKIQKKIENAGQDVAKLRVVLSSLNDLVGRNG